jgi:hypothetical protein
METKTIEPEKIYIALQKIQQELAQIKERLNEENNSEEVFLADENLLAESWLSDEDEKAFAYLQ